MTNMASQFTVPLLDAVVPEYHWEHGDDLCDCEIQNIALSMNPYSGQTLKIRLCCLYKELEDSFPHLFQHIKGYWDDNEQQWITAQMEWNGEDDMPRALWNRQIATREGLPIEVIRERTQFQEPPKGIPRPKAAKEQPMAAPAPATDIYDAYGQLYQKNQALQQGLLDTVSVLRALATGEMTADELEFSEHGFTIKPSPDVQEVNNG